MEKKKVRYNGKTESYYSCSEPTALVLGQEYEVLHQENLGFQTNYTLRGVPGVYNSVWFDSIDGSSNVGANNSNIYMAISDHAPVEGKRFLCSKLEYINGNLKMSDLSTSQVVKVIYTGHNIYIACTFNSIYMVLVRA